MKIIIFLSALLALTAVSAKVIKQNHVDDSIDQEIKFCLASVYTSEKVYHIEEEIYTEEMELLGLDKKCHFIIKNIDVYTPYKFIIWGALKNRIWTIDETKEFRLQK